MEAQQQFHDLIESLKNNKNIDNLKNYIGETVMPCLRKASDQTVIAVNNKLNEKYLLTKQEKYEKLIDEINKFSNSNYSDSQQELERFTKLLEKVKELKMSENIEFFFTMLLVKHGVEKNTLADFEVIKMREVIGNEEIQKRDLIDKVKKNFHLWRLRIKGKKILL